MTSSFVMPLMVGIALVIVALGYLMRRGRGTAATYIAVWLVLALLFGTLVGGLNLRTFYALASRGMRTTGVVTALLPERGNMARYRYQVGGSDYQGSRIPEAPNPPLESLKAGQTVVVYYDPASPATSVLGDPRPMLSNEAASVAAVALVFPTLIVFGQVWQMSRARRRGLRD